MARLERESGAGRGQYSSVGTRREYAYVDGNTVRKVQQAPSKKQHKEKNTGKAVRRNPSYAARMNMGYVLFLTAAALITVFTCVNYLNLQAQNTKLRQEVTSLEVTLDAAKLENDAAYDRIMTSVDMEYVKDVAMNKLGMDYAKKGQIVTYSKNDSDYVRQYQDVPEE